MSKYRTAWAVWPALFLPGPARLFGADRALEIMGEVERRQLADSQSNSGAIFEPDWFSLRNLRRAP